MSRLTTQSRIINAILLLLIIMLMIPMFGQDIMQTDTAEARELELPNPCKPWASSCPGGPWFCFTLGPLTCYMPPFEPN